MHVYQVGANCPPPIAGLFYAGMNLNLWLIFKKTLLSTNLLVYSTINIDI